MKTYTIKNITGLPLMLLMGLFILLSNGCSTDSEEAAVGIHDPMTEAKADFSKAIDLWNHPDNFDMTNGKTEQELLQYRLSLVYPDAVELLIANGMDETTLSQMDMGETFVKALEVHTSHQP